MKLIIVVKKELLNMYFFCEFHLLPGQSVNFMMLTPCWLSFRSLCFQVKMSCVICQQFEHLNLGEVFYTVQVYKKDIDGVGVKCLL